MLSVNNIDIIVITSFTIVNGNIMLTCFVVVQLGAPIKESSNLAHPRKVPSFAKMVSSKR